MIDYINKTRPRLTLSEETTKIISRCMGFEYNDDSMTPAAELMDYYEKMDGVHVLNHYRHTHTENLNFRHIVIDGDMDEATWNSIAYGSLFRLFASGMVKFSDDPRGSGVILKEFDKTIYPVRLTGHIAVDLAIAKNPEMSYVIAGAFEAGMMSA